MHLFVVGYVFKIRSNMGLCMWVNAPLIYSFFVLEVFSYIQYGVLFFDVKYVHFFISILWLCV